MVAAWLAGLAARGGSWLVAGLVLGWLAPALASALRPLLVPALLVPLVVAMLRVDARRMEHLARSPVLAAALLAWLLWLSPALVQAVAAFLAVAEPLRTLVVLHAASAPLLASGALALLLGLEVELALLASLLASLLLPLTLPVLVEALAPGALVLVPGALALRLALLVGGSYLAAALLRRALGPVRLARLAAPLDGISVLALTVFAVAVMDGVRPLVAGSPGFALKALAAAVAVNLGLQALGALLFWSQPRRLALTIGLLSGYRNLGILLAATADVAQPSFLTYVAVAQVPIYLLPALQRPLMARLLRRG